MLKKILCLLACFLLVLTLCGCDIFTADTAELLSPPALTGDLLPIDTAIKESVKTLYTLEYPSRGNYRSAIIQHDMNNDGVLEAFAFYSTQDRETTTMNINAVANKGDRWVSIATQSISAGGVDRIEFSDLDADGIDEILVGWEIYGTSERKLAVYSLGDSSLTQRLLEQYTHFTYCDLDEDSRREIFIARSAPAESRNTAHLYALTSVGVSMISSCELDSTAKTLNHPVVSTLSTGKPAIYIDEIKGVGAVTEVLFLEKGQLQNPLMDPETRETTATLRTATLESRDINGDGIIEIPTRREVATVTKNTEGEKQYLTDWCSFTGETLTPKLTAYMNLNDKFYYTIPKRWLGSVAILSDPENSLTEIYGFDSENNVSTDRLLYIKAVNKTKWDRGDYKGEDVQEIVNNGQTVLVCYISEIAKQQGVTLQKIKNDLKFY
ncbi:MAG: VCBS repeat-containing protein [Clostridia bacterium]|nr:VCBS repeat-containing protein [Clostridia bacterium]